MARVFNKNKTKFSSNNVHESLITTNLKISKLKHHIQHYPYQNISHLLTKLQHYSSLWAADNYSSKTANIFLASIKASFAFIKFYFLKRGFLNGNIGLLISLYNSHHVFYKYAKLFEKNSTNN